MHWGTFVLSAEPVLEPLTRVKAAWERVGLERGNLWDLAVGVLGSWRDGGGGGAYRGAVPRTLRHTPGAALIASVRATAATTPSHGSSKREPPRMPMTW